MNKEYVSRLDYDPEERETRREKKTKKNAEDLLPAAEVALGYLSGCGYDREEVKA